MPKFLPKNILTILLIFLAIAGFFALLASPREKTEVVSLSRLVQEINEEKVSKITIKGNQLEITLQDDEKQKSRKEIESSLTESLANYGLDPQKLALVDVELKDESGAAFWAKAILPFILPFLIIGLFLWFMLRSAQRGTTQAFTLSSL